MGFIEDAAARLTRSQSIRDETLVSLKKHNYSSEDILVTANAWLDRPAHPELLDFWVVEACFAMVISRTPELLTD